MNSVSAPGRRLIGGVVIAACLLGVIAVPEAGAPQNALGGARLLQGGGQAADSGGMIVLLFDTNGMSLAEARSAVASAAEWSDARPAGALTSVVLVGEQLEVLSDFSADRTEVGALLRSEAFLNRLATDPAPQPIRFGASASSPASSQTVPPVNAQLLVDARLRGIKSVCETVAPLPQRKAIIYFSGSLRAGGNQDLLRAATSTCNRANVTINPIDPRGLMNAVTAQPK